MQITIPWLIAKLHYLRKWTNLESIRFQQLVYIGKRRGSSLIALHRDTLVATAATQLRKLLRCFLGLEMRKEFSLNQNQGKCEMRTKPVFLSSSWKVTVQEKIITPVRQIHLFVNYYLSRLHMRRKVQGQTSFWKKMVVLDIFQGMDAWIMLDNGPNNRYFMVMHHLIFQDKIFPS